MAFIDNGNLDKEFPTQPGLNLATFDTITNVLELLNSQSARLVNSVGKQLGSDLRRNICYFSKIRQPCQPSINQFRMENFTPVMPNLELKLLKCLKIQPWPGFEQATSTVDTITQRHLTLYLFFHRNLR